MTAKWSIDLFSVPKRCNLIEGHRMLAWTFRIPSGAWQWQLVGFRYGPWVGIEPTRDYAMDAAEAAINKARSIDANGQGYRQELPPDNSNADGS